MLKRIVPWVVCACVLSPGVVSLSSPENAHLSRSAEELNGPVGPKDGHVHMHKSTHAVSVSLQGFECKERQTARAWRAGGGGDWNEEGRSSKRERGECEAVSVCVCV